MYTFRIRAIVGVFIFIGYFLMYVIRYNISVHVIDMVQLTSRDERKVYYNNSFSKRTKTGRSGFYSALNTIENIITILGLAGGFVGVNMVLNSPLGTALFLWTKRTLCSDNIVDIISWDDMNTAKLFAAYHIGYCICFPIFHNLGDRLGPKWVVGISGLISGILCCLAPASAYYHFWALFMVRIVKGFCAGAMQPSMVQVLRHWVPPVERLHFMWAYCGITTGTFSTFLICAAIQYYSRWPVGFYIFGSLQIIWSALWVLIVTDNPRNHPCISEAELTYLTNTVETIFTIQVTNSRAPWKLILKSIPFWALCILNFGYSWMIISLCIHGPLYYSKVVKLNIYQASAMTALPFFLRLVLGTILIQTFHWYKYNTELKRIKHIRKYFIFVSHVLPGLLVSVSWFLPIVPGPILLTIAVTLTAAGMDLTSDLCYELTPTFMNSINAVIKIIANFSGIIVSLCVGKVTQTYSNSPYVWKHIWCFHATLLFLSGCVFLIWGETKVQPWNSGVYRHQRKQNVKQKISVMSNIIELDEDVSSTRSKLRVSLKK